MVGIMARGRIAWILAAVLGAVLLIIGIALSNSFLIIAGIVILAFGVIFLIASIATKGRSD